MVSTNPSDLVFALVEQYAMENDDGTLYSGCLSAMADAMRWLASQGMAEMLEDGPGRHVVIRLKYQNPL